MAANMLEVISADVVIIDFLASWGQQNKLKIQYNILWSVSKELLIYTSSETLALTWGYTSGHMANSAVFMLILALFSTLVL